MPSSCSFPGRGFLASDFLVSRSSSTTMRADSDLELLASLSAPIFLDRNPSVLPTDREAMWRLGESSAISTLLAHAWTFFATDGLAAGRCRKFLGNGWPPPAFCLGFVGWLFGWGVFFLAFLTQFVSLTTRFLGGLFGLVSLVLSGDAGACPCLCLTATTFCCAGFFCLHLILSRSCSVTLSSSTWTWTSLGSVGGA